MAHGVGRVARALLETVTGRAPEQRVMTARSTDARAAGEDLEIVEHRALLAIGVAAGSSERPAGRHRDEERRGLDLVARRARPASTPAHVERRDELRRRVDVADPQHDLVATRRTSELEQVVDDALRARALGAEDVDREPARRRDGARSVEQSRAEAVGLARGRHREQVAREHPGAEHRHDRRTRRRASRLPRPCVDAGEPSRSLTFGRGGDSRLDREPDEERRPDTHRRLEASRSPPCFSTIVRAIDSPWPVPLPTSLVVKNGSKIRFRDVRRDAATGVGDRDHDDVAPSTRVAIRIVPRSPVARTTSAIACAALTMMLRNTWFSSLMCSTRAVGLAELGLHVGDVAVLVASRSRSSIRGRC